MLIISCIITSIVLLYLHLQTKIIEEEKLKKLIEKEADEVIQKYLTMGYKPRKTVKVELKGKAVWLWGITVEEYGAKEIVEKLHKYGFKHIFLLVRGVSGVVVTEKLEQILPLAHEKGMYVHAWIVCFPKKEFSPMDPNYRKYLLEVILKFILLNVSRHYIDGIHLDYIRFGGSAKGKTFYITSFVKSVRKIIDTFAPGLVLSIASKAENYDSEEGLLESALYYGQDYKALAKYVDLFCPMTYYLDYKVEPLDAVRACTWVKKITKKAVFMGIQCHPCEHDPSRKPSPNEIIVQIKKAKENGLDGVIFFNYRWIVKNNLWNAVNTKFDC